jgi:hypothetical protein
VLWTVANLKHFAVAASLLFCLWTLLPARTNRDDDTTTLRHACAHKALRCMQRHCHKFNTHCQTLTTNHNDAIQLNTSV